MNCDQAMSPAARKARGKEIEMETQGEYGGIEFREVVEGRPGFFRARFIVGRAEMPVLGRFRTLAEAAAICREAAWWYAYQNGLTAYQGRKGYPGETCSGTFPVPEQYRYGGAR